ncbi:uncharacterized protein LOC106078316 [Biomphalaria glabrata]|uniref:Uncharacterized protein LOC106078316 n=1 Tax=Biomphalaria glabrata TaxID=6526 RepID=A0A9W2ZT18_BIOGL|nr:uncharacterized protein LOC106078316 [Biomphalaria glabrata]
MATLYIIYLGFIFIFLACVGEGINWKSTRKRQRLEDMQGRSSRKGQVEGIQGRSSRKRQQMEGVQGKSSRKRQQVEGIQGKSSRKRQQVEGIQGKSSRKSPQMDYIKARNKRYVVSTLDVKCRKSPGFSVERFSNSKMCLFWATNAKSFPSAKADCQGL